MPPNDELPSHSVNPSEPDRVDLMSTGIPGLDNILAGGLPRGHLYLVSGDPGAGKTTLGLQFLLEGVRAGESVLYITLSESENELRQVARSHRWSLDQMPIFELLPMEESLKAEEQYTILYPSEVELSDTMKAILERVEELRPRRVIFDSLSELRLLARDSLRYRRQILALKQFFSARHVTVLMLDDGTGQDDDRDLQSIAHGVVGLENLSRQYGSQRRRLRVRKLRGIPFREGYHDYDILTGGLRVYSRLVATQHRTSFPAAVAGSGIPELDALLGGGLNYGTSTLLLGPAGAGKSTIALHYAAAAAERGEHAAFFAFDEGMPTLIERSSALGINIEPLLEAGTLRIHFVDPAELSPGQFVGEVCAAVEDQQARVVAIDSLNGLLAAMPDEQHLTIQLHELLSYLNFKGVLSLLVVAQYGILGQGMQTPIDASYLADTILLLRYFESRGTVRQAISVVKKRSGAHERTIRELQFGPERVRVGEPLREFQGVLTGVPSFVGVQGSLMEDVTK